MAHQSQLLARDAAAPKAALAKTAVPKAAVPQAAAAAGAATDAAPSISVALRKPTCLHLFSGPRDRPDGLFLILRWVGWNARDVDIVNVGSDGDRSPHDLSSDLL